MSYPKLLQELIDQFTKLPGIGRRSAERIAFWLLDNPIDDAKGIAGGIMNLKQSLRFCTACNNFSEQDLCDICRNPRRDASIICVVENPKDVLAIEQTGAFQGTYYVLLGALSPTEGRGPEDVKINPLIDRIKKDAVKEIIIATDADTEGQMTALHIANELKDIDVKISRIGLGIPVGSAVEYADLSTLSMSLTSRREI